MESLSIVLLVLFLRLLSVQMFLRSRGLVIDLFQKGIKDLSPDFFVVDQPSNGGAPTGGVVPGDGDCYCPGSNKLHGYVTEE